jgi:hypothetical protein
MSKHGIGTPVVSIVMVLGVVTTVAFAQGSPFEPNLANVAAGTDGKVLNRTTTATDKEGRPAVRFDEREGDGLALWPDVEFSDGTIEFDARGKDVSMSFVGIAFHGMGSACEAVYFRPFNFRNSDPAARAHAVQYVSNPVYTWDRLRNESPGKYEKPVAPAPDPNAWFHARIVVAYPMVSVFVNGAAEPSLAVEQLSGRKAGWLGLWVGNASGGEFANVKVTSVLKKKTYFALDSRPIPDREPKVTGRFRAMIQDALNGGMRPEDYAPEFWAQISPLQKDVQADLMKSGELVSLSLIDRQVAGARRSYRYLLEFKNARAVELFVLDEHDQIALIQSEASEAKPEAAAAGKK